MVSSRQDLPHPQDFLTFNIMTTERDPFADLARELSEDDRRLAIPQEQELLDAFNLGLTGQPPVSGFPFLETAPPPQSPPPEPPVEEPSPELALRPEETPPAEEKGFWASLWETIFKERPLPESFQKKQQAVGETILKGIEFAFLPFTLYGEAQRGIVEGQEELRGISERVLAENKRLKEQGITGQEAQDRLMAVWDEGVAEISREDESIGEAFKEMLPGGQAYQEYTTLPLLEQLKYEWPAWAMTLGTSATEIRAVLAPAAARPGIPAVAPKVVRAALLPIEIAEVVPGILIGKTVNATYRTAMSASLRRNLRSWAKSVGKTIPRETEDAFVKTALDELSPKFMVKEAAKTLFKPVKGGYAVTDAGVKAAETAATDAVRTSPLLLKATREAVTPPVTPTGAVPAVVPPKPPTVAPVTPVVPEPPIDEFRVRLTGEIAKGQAEITARLAPEAVPEVTGVLEAARIVRGLDRPFRGTEQQITQHLQGSIIERLGTDPTITLYRGSRVGGKPLLKPLTKPRDTEVGDFWTTDIEIAKTYGDILYKVDVKASELANYQLTTLVGGTQKEIHLSPTIQRRAELVKPPAVEAVPQVTTANVNAIQAQGRTAPETVPPQDAQYAHTELASPDGTKPPKSPVVTPEAREPDDILREIAEKATLGERPDQTLLRLYEGGIGAQDNITNIAIKEANQMLRDAGIGTWSRDQLVILPKDKATIKQLNIALHNPSGVLAGTVEVPKGLEGVYERLRSLTDWDEMQKIDFDPNTAIIDDYFYRGWKPPKGSTTEMSGGRLLLKIPSSQKVRVNASYEEMLAAGFEPLFDNPVQQWGYSRGQGVRYRGQTVLVNYLKGIGDEFIRPSDGGPIPKGWRVPEVGPAFEGKPFAIADPITGEPTVMFSRRWLVPDRIANSLENIYGKKPDLGKFIIAGKTIDPLTIIDALVFLPKRAKLFASFFQQVDFLTRSGAGTWTRFVDELSAGRPIEAIKAPARYPLTVFSVLRANFSPAKRLSLAKQLDSTTSLVEGRPGITLKGISEAGLSTRDVTIFPADMDKLVHQMAQETGILGVGRGFVRLVGDLESAMRRGLFDGVYPAAIITDIQNNIAPMVARQYSSLNDAQINGMIARIANIKYSTIPASQSVIQNRVLREGLRRLFFSVGESEGLLRQATGAFKGPYASYWRRHWIGVYLFLITMASVIHYASTGEPLPLDRYSPISKDNWGPLPFGYNRDFAAPTLPFKGRGEVELTLDLAGQMDTAFRILNPVNFITSRESVPVRTAWNQITGADFYGASIDDVGPGGIISRTSQLLFDLFAPIGLGGIGVEVARQALPEAGEVLPEVEERLGLTGLGIQATGINIRAETTMQLLDRFAKESGFFKADGTSVETWADLEPFQKRELSNNIELQTELGLRSKAAIERQQLKAEGFATLDDIDKERIVRGEALVSELLQELMDSQDFRDEVTLLKREMSARKAQVDIDFQLFQETNILPKDPNKRALVEYYNTFDKAKRASGVIDWDKQERLENTLRLRWTDTQEAYVDRNTGLTEWGPLMAEYNQAIERLKPYWELSAKPSSIRRNYRIANPDVDAVLVQWYGYKPAIGQTPTAPTTQPTEEDLIKAFQQGLQ